MSETTYSNTPAPSLTLEALLEAMCRFEAIPPFMVELWCFDCHPNTVTQLRALYPQSPASTPRLLFSVLVPLYEWYSWLEKPNDRPRPEAFISPGVYAKMSDGTWRRL